MSERRLDSTGDPGHSDEEPTPWAPPTMPDDARSLGLDRNTEEGAWVMMASSLDSSSSPQGRRLAAPARARRAAGADPAGRLARRLTSPIATCA